LNLGLKIQIKKEIYEYYSQLNKEHQKRFWIYFPPTLNSPPLVRRHTAVLNGDSIYVFGGVSGPENSQNTRFHNNIYRLNGLTNEWSIVKETNKIKGRCGHAAVNYEHYMYIFGGSYSHGESKTYMRDFSRFDFYTNTWEVLNERIPDQNTPPPLAFHQMCLYDHKLILCGGALNSRSGIATDLIFIFDLKKMIWKRVNTRGMSHNIHEMVSHNCVIYKNNLYLIELSKYLHKLNLKTFQWSVVCELPEEIIGFHSRTSINYEDKLYVYGGIHKFKGFISDSFHEFDFGSETWKKVKTYGYGPLKRSKQTMNLNYKNELVFFGGFSVNEDFIMRDFNDTYVFKFGIDHILNINRNFEDVEIKFLK
jgi:N-acetylneuraminic acid mutarotase